MRLIDWIKKNKLATFLILVVCYLLFKSWTNPFPTPPPVPMFNSAIPADLKMAIPRSGGAGGNIGFMPPVQENFAPQPDIKNRMVVQESNISLLVKDAKDTINKIIDYANNNSGYMVNSSLNTPGETTSGIVVIRIPTKSLKQTLEFLRGLSIKVVSENLYGNDVTDQYVDIKSRLDTLYKTKTKFEDMLDKSANVQDLLNVQREIINLQTQIDYLIGQQQYLEKTSESARITIYVSTDEIALPYTPDDSWRPDVIFKLAVRSVISNLRSIGSNVIWIAVYSVFWIPTLAIILIIKKRFFKSA